jgi:hypothetical protein
MPTQTPLATGADFVVFEPGVQFVSTSFPFSRIRFVRISGSDMVITMGVKTGYSDLLKQASVLVNGKNVGVVDPRPWTNHDLIDMESVTFIVPQAAMPAALDTIAHVGVVTIQIVPVNSADPDNFLLVGPVVCQLHVMAPTLP